MKSSGLLLDTDAVLRFLREQAFFPQSLKREDARCTASQFGHGQSNPTYLIQVTCPEAPWNGAGAWKAVLRKKPPGKLLASAHAVEREFQVLEALGKVGGVPVPAVFCLCRDSLLLGTPFYLMEFLDGRILKDPDLPGLSPPERQEVYLSVARTLASLHSAPLPPSMQSFGRLEAYCTRQTERWWRQFQGSLSALDQLRRGNALRPQAPQMERVYRWLQANMPSGDAAPVGPTKGLVHGDFRIDNLVFHPTEPRVIGVLDWELSTLGDQMVDLTSCCMAYHIGKGQRGPSSPAPSAAGAARDQLLSRLTLVPSGAPAAEGVPSEHEFLREYVAACQRLKGVDVWPGDQLWRFYLILSLFRAASIMAGVFQRSQQGNASSSLAGGAAHTAAFLLERAEALMPATGAPQEPLSSSAPAGTPTAHSASAPPQAVGLGPSPRAEALQRRVRAFIEEHVMPLEGSFEAQALAQGPQRWEIHPKMEELKSKARAQGLWNLWLPADAQGHLKPSVRAELLQGDAEHQRQAASVGGLGGPPAWGVLGPGLSNLEYAHVCIEMGRSVWAPEVFNCSAPDTGNMEVLLRYGSEAQQRQWLVPLLQGSIRSGFAMTEPGVASSDATNISGNIRRDGDSYVINGRKWWTSGACDPRCRILVFMGKHQPPQDSGRGPASPAAGGEALSKHRQQSMVLVPVPSPGVEILRPLLVFGFDDAPHGHAEVSFKDVRVPLGNMLLGEGRGFEIAQGRLGPGRLHHCMRLIGAGDRGVEAMVHRAAQRVAFGRPLAHNDSVLQRLAECRITLEGARLLLLNAALQLDVLGNKHARIAIAAAKVQVPRAVQGILDWAIQLHGAAGVCQDFPLARLWIGARTIRIADGPDEVHLLTMGRNEMKGAKRLPVTVSRL